MIAVTVTVGLLVGVRVLIMVGMREDLEGRWVGGCCGALEELEDNGEDDDALG